MSLTLLAPALAGPAAAQLGQRRMRVPSLESLLTSARIEQSAESLERYAARLLGIDDEAPPPIAALRLAAEKAAPAPAGDDWLCADPVAATLLMDNVRIDGAVTDLSRAHADALLGAMNDCFGNDGIEFVAPDVGRWYVRIGAPQQIRTTPLWRTIGGSMRDALPSGPDAALWRRRLNEAQMLLHTHPVNDERERDGLRRIATLWFWGEGHWPRFGPAQVDELVGGPQWIGGAGAANGVAASRPEPAALSAPAPGRRRLIVLDDDWERDEAPHERFARWDDEWFDPLRRLLDERKVEGATLVFPTETGVARVACPAPERSHWPQWLRWSRHDPRAPAPTVEEALRGIA